MKPIGRVLPGHLLTLVLLLLFGAAAHGQVGSEVGIQVLTRGPVHEAFAEAAMEVASASVIVSRGPPEPIREFPPEQRPVGNDIGWVPGYWNWDEERDDFIWISGVWRDVPPGRQWVPGYWATVSQGKQWISGYWGDDAQTDVMYLPPPPQSIDNGPVSPSPGASSVWASGCWVWQHSRYDWQPGYWVVQQPNWVWAPARYTWTPRGHVYVPGYWDHEFVSRGVMFAPLYYEQPIYRSASYSYLPRVIISIAAVAAFLFVHERSNHYYYGDYYDRRYEDRGYRPWYKERGGHRGYDHNYAGYRREQLDRDPRWDMHIDEQFRRRRERVEERPPATLALQVNFFNTGIAGERKELAIGRELSEAVKEAGWGSKFRPVSAEERKEFERRGNEVHRFQVERAELEQTVAPAADTDPTRESRAEPYRAKMRRSPVSSGLGVKPRNGVVVPPAPSIPAPRDADKERTEGIERGMDTQRKRSQSLPAADSPRVAPERSRTKERPVQLSPAPGGTPVKLKKESGKASRENKPGIRTRDRQEAPEVGVSRPDRVVTAPSSRPEKDRKNGEHSSGSVLPKKDVSSPVEEKAGDSKRKVLRDVPLRRSSKETAREDKSRSQPGRSTENTPPGSYKREEVKGDGKPSSGRTRPLDGKRSPRN